MESLLVLLALALLVLPIAGFLIALSALSRARAASTRAGALESDVAQLQREVLRLRGRATTAEGAAERRAEAARTAPTPATGLSGIEAPATPVPRPPFAVEPAEPAEPSPPPQAPEGPAPREAEPPSTPVPPPPVAVGTGAASPAFEASAPAAPLATDRGGARDGTASAPPPARPPEPPPGPPPTGPPRAPRGVDWERWIGVRGAAVVAGILLALAGVYFVRYSIENGWLSPTVRVALGLLTGLAALVGSELLRRRDYEDASNGLAGGGIVVLYAAVWAARSLYGLIPVALAFALMVLITAVCGLLAWRRTSLVVALLGLIGGFATPLLVSAKPSSPLGLFGYLLLLNAGLLFLSRKRGWAIIPPLGLLATLFYEGLWIFGDMTPSELPLALAILTVFAALFVFALVKAVPAAGPGRGAAEGVGVLGRGTRAAAVLLPFGFALYFALRADLGVHLWPVAAMLLVLTVGAQALARAWGDGRGLAWLGTAAAVAAVTVVAVWALGHRATVATAWELTGIAAALALACHAFAERDSLLLRRRRNERGERVDVPETETGWPAPGTPAGTMRATSAGIAAGALFGLLLLDGLVDPVPAAAARLVGWAVLTALLVRQSAFPGTHRRQAGAALALGATLPLFHLAHSRQTSFPDPVLYFGLLLAAAVAFQLLPLLRREGDGRRWAERAATALPLGALVVLFGQASDPHLAPWLFLATTLALAVLATLGATRLERGAGIGVLLAMALTACGHLLWALDGAGRTVAGVPPAPMSAATLGLAGGALGVLFFTAWPFLARPRLDSDRWAWYAAALAAPAWFLALGTHWETLFGDGALGALPVALGAVSLAATARVRTLWSADDPRRLRGLVWFAAVALGFAALAIPLQLEREWVTIGWALEGVAVIALWRRLDHAGLKLFGLGLLATAAARVLLLPFGARTAGSLGWLAYTHLVPAAALVGAALLLEPLEVGRLRRDRRLYPVARPLGAMLTGVAAIVLGFVWLTRSVGAFFGEASTATAVAGLTRGARTGFAASMAHDLSLSIAWALYALLLLGLGFGRRSRGLRGLGLGLLAVTVVKVFLFDLSGLEDLYRVASLVGLAVSLLLVSLAYQRFVFRTDRSGIDP